MSEFQLPSPNAIVDSGKKQCVMLAHLSPSTKSESGAAVKALAMGEAPIAARAISFSAFPDVKAKTIDRHTWSWGELVLAVKEPANSRKSKSACPLIKLATFGDKPTASGCLRSDENMQSVTGVEGDYDDGVVTPGEAAARLERAGVEAVIYTTASNTPAKPRWRVLVPLSRPYDPGERAHFVALLNGASTRICLDSVKAVAPRQRLPIAHSQCADFRALARWNSHSGSRLRAARA